MLLAIDPGDVQSAWVLYDDVTKAAVDYGLEDNEAILGKLQSFRQYTDQLVIEMIASYGMPVGKTIFETCVWIGRFRQAWTGHSVDLVYRADVKLHLCQSPRAKDANVRQAILDRYGGDKKRACGTKKNPGPLYGMAKDMWAAMGVALTFAGQ